MLRNLLCKLGWHCWEYQDAWPYERRRCECCGLNGGYHYYLSCGYSWEPADQAIEVYFLLREIVIEHLAKPMELSWSNYDIDAMVGMMVERHSNSEPIGSSAGGPYAG